MRSALRQFRGGHAVWPTPLPAPGLRRFNEGDHPDLAPSRLRHSQQIPVMRWSRSVGLPIACVPVVRRPGLGYGFSVATPTVTFDSAEKEASDSLQAAYFRGALADQRALVAAEIMRQTRTLNGLSTKTDALAISQLRRDIRANEVQCRDLDRMIAALDRRFAALG